MWLINYAIGYACMLGAGAPIRLAAMSWTTMYVCFRSDSSIGYVSVYFNI